jgi:predicted phosphoadenosine phosphosulfate sulfurtransferase
MSLTICATFSGGVDSGVRVLFQVVARFQRTFFASVAHNDETVNR